MGARFGPLWPFASPHKISFSSALFGMVGAYYTKVHFYFPHLGQNQKNFAKYFH
jgi:hypothetical protein